MHYHDLNDHPLLRFLSPSEIALVESIAVHHTFTEGDIIIRNNDRNRDIMVVDSGMVAVTILNLTGDEVEVTRIGAGKLIGEMNFIVPTRRTANVTAICEVQLTLFPYKPLTELLMIYTPIADKIFAAINVSLAEKLLSTLSDLR